MDLLATVDASTTVGDLAGYLARADPRGRTADVPADDSEVTLGLIRGDKTVALDPRALLANSGCRSGGAVTIARSGRAFQDLHAEAAAVLSITDGPGSGTEFNLAVGTNIAGREPSCEIQLPDPLVSRQHARFNVTDIVEIVDLGSANGIVLGGATVARAVLRLGDSVQLGDTVLTLQQVASPALRPRSDASAVSFVRSPVLNPRFEGESFKAPEPPERPRPPRFPFIALIAPLFIGAALFAITKSAASLAFIALSPLMLIGNAIEARMTGRSDFRQALEQWRADLVELVGAMTATAELEVTQRNREHPSVGACLDAARDRSPLVWSRRPGEPGFIEFRLGTGQQPTRSTVEYPDARRSARDLFVELTTSLGRFATVSNVPIIAAPATSGSVGYAGPRAQLLGAVRGLLVQAAVLHSPAELVVAAIASHEAAMDWDWLKWLPHSTSPNSPLSVRHLAADASTATALVVELETVVEGRLKSDDPIALPTVMVLVDSEAPAEHNRLVQLGESGWKVGVHLVWLARSVASLPAPARTYVDLDGPDGATAVGFVDSGSKVTPVTVEMISNAQAAALAREMAPVVDVGARSLDASDLPRTVSLLTLTGVDLARRPSAVLERWIENSSIVSGPCAPGTAIKRSGTLRAIVGQAAGEPLALDLRADGPHALVGGTTGSGKSELLQAWILALATAHSPQRLTFLLVDYKGGSAFRDCTELPHAIGLVTDLSPHLVRRALTSLKAELRHREHLLGRYGAKDLATLERMGVKEAPPSLVIVVDEFAALINEVPEFVDGVVDVAQRGRSLGLHLILATQRPAGVIRDSLRANTNLRVALRVADEDDSTDVLGAPDAAYFDQAIPGRAVSKTGPDRLVPFQSAYAGGWTPDEAPPPEMEVEELVFGAGTPWEDEREPEAQGDHPTDIKRLVATVQRANKQAEIPSPRKAWLPELRPLYDLADQDLVPSRRTDSELVFGVRDYPENQAQPTIAFHPDRDGNLAVYGAGGSGKTTLLRTLAVAAGFTIRGGPCQIYGIDFGAHGLAVLEDLPHVGSVIDGSDHERIVRLLTQLRTVIDDRAALYSRVDASTITEYRKLGNAPNEQRLLLIVDGVAAFRQTYEASERSNWFDVFTSIAAEGRPVGVHVIVSSDQRAGLTVALASAVQSRVVLRLASDDDYGMLGVPKDVLSVSSPTGRSLVGDAEVQVAVLGGTGDVVRQGAAIRTFGAAMTRAGVRDAAPIDRLSTRITVAELPRDQAGPVIGLKGSSLGPCVIEPHGTFIVTGPPGTGRTMSLRGIIESIRCWRPQTQFHYFGNRRSSLAELSLWTTASVTPADIAERAGALAVSLTGSTTDVPVVVIIEGVAEMTGGLADEPLHALVKACLSEDLFVVAEGETSSLSASFGLLGAIKTSRTGIALGPDQSDGMTIFRTNFPRVTRSEFPPGRALHVALGRTDVVQVAVAEGEEM